MKKVLPLLIACLASSIIIFSCKGIARASVVPADMFCITALEGGLEVSMEFSHKQYPHTSPSLLYSLDGRKWNDFIADQSVVTLPTSGSRLYMKANGRNGAFAFDAPAETPVTIIAHTFKFSKRTKVSGNIMYLLDGKYPEEAMLDTLAFAGLFFDDSLLVDASELRLPAEQLNDRCYMEMFESTSISKAPELPAMQMKISCYASMFHDCHNLTVAPELPAAKLDKFCYNGMFSNCARLTIAPKLPATQLSETCYCMMFHRCTSLMEAPELPATKLEPYCYYGMFAECTSMTSLTCMAIDISAEKCVAGFLNGIDTKGTFHAAPGTDWTGRIPVTWMVEY